MPWVFHADSIVNLKFAPGRIFDYLIDLYTRTSSGITLKVLVSLVKETRLRCRPVLKPISTLIPQSMRINYLIQKTEIKKKYKLSNLGVNHNKLCTILNLYGFSTSSTDECIIIQPYTKCISYNLDDIFSEYITC